MTTLSHPPRSCDRVLDLPGLLSRPWSGPLIAALFYVPFGLRPGVIAYVCAILRATVLSYAVGFGLIGLAGPWLEHHQTLARLIVVFVFAGFEELARLGFAWRAADRRRALWFFCCAIVLVETLTFAVSAPAGTAPLVFVFARAPSAILHVAATIALLWGLGRSGRLWRAEILIIAVHTAFNFEAPAILEWLNAHFA